jgi:hypothetical protein
MDTLEGAAVRATLGGDKTALATGLRGERGERAEMSRTFETELVASLSGC